VTVRLTPHSTRTLPFSLTVPNFSAPLIASMQATPSASFVGKFHGFLMTIRPETDADFPAIDRINRDAFLHHPYSHQTEHLIVRALRASKALTLALVAEADGQVVGHVAFSPALIAGQDLGWYTLGPVAVLPAFQGKGIGSSLIQAGLQGIRALGASGCLLVGDPDYYRRFGFQNDASLHVDEVPPDFFMCLAFHGTVPHGLATHHPAFFTTA